MLGVVGDLDVDRSCESTTRSGRSLLLIEGFVLFLSFETCYKARERDLLLHTHHFSAIVYVMWKRGGAGCGCALRHVAGRGGGAWWGVAAVGPRCVHLPRTIKLCTARLRWPPRTVMLIMEPDCSPGPVQLLLYYCAVGEVSMERTTAFQAVVARRDENVRRMV